MYSNSVRMVSSGRPFLVESNRMKISCMCLLLEADDPFKCLGSLKPLQEGSHRQLEFMKNLQSIWVTCLDLSFFAVRFLNFAIWFI